MKRLIVIVVLALAFVQGRASTIISSSGGPANATSVTTTNTVAGTASFSMQFDTEFRIMTDPLLTPPSYLYLTASEANNSAYFRHFQSPDLLQTSVGFGVRAGRVGFPDEVEAKLDIDPGATDDQAQAQIVLQTQFALLRLDENGLFSGTFDAIKIPSLMIGATGTAITGSFRAARSLDVGSIAGGSCLGSFAFGVTGAVLGAECIVGVTAELTTSNVQATCGVSSADNVSMTLCNNGFAAFDPSPGTYSVRVFNP